MNDAAPAAVNIRFWNSVRSSMGERPRRSMTTNSGSSTIAATKPPITSGSFQPVSAPLDRASTSPLSPMTNAAVPGRSSPRSFPRPDISFEDEPGPRRSGEAERDVEPEDPAPGDEHERAAEHRPDHQPDRGDHRVRPHRQPELVLREGVGDERGGVREQEGGAETLHHPPEDQLRAAAGEPGAERRERERDEAEHVGVLPPEQVGQPSRREHEDGRDDHVDEDHPDELEQRRVQAPLEVGERDDQRPRVDGRQEHPERRAGQDPPLEVVAVAACPEEVHSYVNVNLAEATRLAPCTSSRPRGRCRGVALSSSRRRDSGGSPWSRRGCWC